MPPYDGVNYPGPYELRIFYSWTYGGLYFNSVLRHSLDMETPANPGDAFTEWVVADQAPPGYALDIWVDNLVAALQPLFHTSTNFNRAELWYYPGGTYNAQFQSTYTLGVAGTSSSSTKRANQVIITFRSVGGGSARLTLGGTVNDVNITDPYPFAVSDANNLAELFVSAASPVIARDGTSLFTPLNYMAGENEAYFKKQYRP